MKDFPNYLLRIPECKTVENVPKPIEEKPTGESIVLNNRPFTPTVVPSILEVSTNKQIVNYNVLKSTLQLTKEELLLFDFTEDTQTRQTEQEQIAFGNHTPFKQPVEPKIYAKKFTRRNALNRSLQDLLANEQQSVSYITKRGDSSHD